MPSLCCNHELEKNTELNKLKSFFALLSDTNRLRILCCLSKKEHCVCELVEMLDLPQNLVSHHLSKLKLLTLVKERKEGSFIFYRIDSQILGKYFSLFNSIINIHDN
jgi:ArsR family transcriptional regulator